MNNVLNERTTVELPFIAQLVAMGWQYIEGDTDVPDFTERETFREVLLKPHLRAALRRVNLDDDGQPWLDDDRINRAVSDLDRLEGKTHKLLEANQTALDLLLKGTTVEGDPDRDGGKERTVRYLDVDHPERNDFLVVNQFRVDGPAGGATIVPDLVLFVNGIPLAVVECKSPAITDPLDQALDQLLRYSNQCDWVEADEGVERLFWYNQLLVATCFTRAVTGAVGAGGEDYLAWKDTTPVPLPQVAADLGLDSPSRLSAQQILAAGLLRPAHLLDLVRNFTLFRHQEGRTEKVVARYQQFRAVHEAVRRLRTGQSRRQHGLTDQRGGVVWHTQGSGKSLTMVFLVRKLRSIPDLEAFKVVVITDRNDLEDQLSATAVLTGETVTRARGEDKLKEILRQDGPDLVFAKIQQYQSRDLEGELPPTSLPALARLAAPAPTPMAAEERAPYHADVPTTDPATADIQPASAGFVDVDRGFIPGRSTGANPSLSPHSDASPEIDTPPTPAARYPILNESESILVLVEEAHRSHASALHANLLHALPNCARLGFTGTPILAADKKRTEEIFGPIIDRYDIRQSQADGATVEILYEGRTEGGGVADRAGLDRAFEDMFVERTPKERERIKAKYATRSDVLSAPKLIAAKAEDMLRHYVDTVLPNGFKAQVVASSRAAAVLYQRALTDAHRALLAELDALDPALLVLDPEARLTLEDRTQFLLRAHAHLDLIRRLESAAVISGGGNTPADWRVWTEKRRQDDLIARFKKPLVHPDPTKPDGLAFLCVRTMLLTGFDAPVEQVLYLDRFMKDHELLQAIARVNRTAPGKTNGLVVDYFGVANHLHAALAAYAQEEIQGALVNLRDELPKLDDRHRRVLAVFHDRGLVNLAAEWVACVDLLRDQKIRAEFAVKLKRFLETLDVILPRPEALPYVNDAKLLGFINKSAATLYRDEGLNVAGAGQKVRRLIDEHVVARGVNPKIPPISILAADFARHVDARPTIKAKASEMEHAARYHIAQRYNEDPAYYKKLSERLEEILQTFQNNWDDLVAALRGFTQEVREGRPADESGLDPRTQAPFLGILVEEVGTGEPLPGERLDELAGVTIEMVEHVRREIAAVDFWRNPEAQRRLKGWVVDFLDAHDAVPFNRQGATADRVVELARHLHARLVS